MTDLAPLASATLPPGIRARFVEGVNGLRLHMLEAGYETVGRPLVLLLHGFPELAYSWRKVMLPLAAAGCHVVAPDQRGYGRTTGWSDAYDQDLRPFSLMRLAGDAVALVQALGYRSVAAVVGHDFGSPVAAWCALSRPDVFRSVVMMSAPFAGPPEPGASAAVSPDVMATALAALPRPRKHYQWYYATRAANAEMCSSAAGISGFLRAYFHHKSADWAGNTPFRLADGSAEQLAGMPAYYIMDLATTMPETVAPFRPSAPETAACAWLTDAELAVYAGEFERTGFQGGLNWYRTRFDPAIAADYALYAGCTIDVPSLFLAGKSDWGIYQVPGALERMQATVCTRMLGCDIVEGAGHWVMQEQAEIVSARLVGFLQDAR